MIVKDLLPVLPRYSDDSGYNLCINYISDITITECGKVCNKVKINKHYEKCRLHNDSISGAYNGNGSITRDRVLDSMVAKITSGIYRIGGHYDEDLQIWLETEEFAIIKDNRKGVVENATV